MFSAAKRFFTQVTEEGIIPCAAQKLIDAEDAYMLTFLKSVGYSDVFGHMLWNVRPLETLIIALPSCEAAQKSENLSKAMSLMRRRYTMLRQSTSTRKAGAA